MSIIFIPDPHGSICQIIQAGIQIRPKAIITVGDNQFKRKPYCTLFEELLDLGICVYTIDGNHDGRGSYLKCNEKYRLDGKTVEINGMRVSGSSLYSTIKERDYIDSDIFVCHHPVRAWNHSLDSIHYSECMTEEAKNLKSKIVFHGHIHPRRGCNDTGLYMEQGLRCVSLGNHVYDNFGNIAGFIGLNDSRDQKAFYPGINSNYGFLDEWRPITQECGAQ